MTWSRCLLTSAMAAALLLSACGRSPSLGFGAHGAAQSLATAPLPISVHFTDAYKPTMAANEPLARANPNNPDKPLLLLIRTATKTLDGAFYDIEDLGVAKAFVAAKARGVRVRLVTDTDNLSDKVDPAKPRPAIALLLAAGIPVVDDKRSGLMHHKFLVADQAALWTGSTNLTTTSLYRNNNNALLVRSAPVAKAYATEFERLFTKNQFALAAREGVGGVAPIRLASGATMRIFFSPGGGGRAAVQQVVQSAKKSLRFLTFSLTEPQLGATMVAKASAGVKVEGVFDRWLAAGKYSLFQPFKTAKLAVWKDGNEALMHHKVIMVDGQTLITGSYNYSQNAEVNNNEAFMIFEGAPTLSKAFDQEFDRVQRVASQSFQGRTEAGQAQGPEEVGSFDAPPLGGFEDPELMAEDAP